MSEQPTGLWNKLVEQPRRFFMWLAVVSLTLLVLLFLVGTAFQHTQPSSLVQSLAAFLLVGAVICFLAGFFGFFLALIPPLQPLFRWLVRRSIFIAACLITLGALFYALENWRGQRAWESFKREAAAKKEPLEVQEIIPPAVSEEQNFAAAPLLKDLCNEFDPEWRRLHSGPDGLTNTADRLKLSHLHRNERAPQEAEANWQKGQRTDLKAWQEYYRNPPATGSKPMTNEFPIAAQPQSPAADVLLALSKYDAVIEELRGASERPHSRFPIRYEDGFSALLPHLARLKGINQLLAMRATAELELGQTDKAVADVKLILRVADLIRDEPLLISQLVRLAQLQIAINPIWEGLVEHRWTDAQLAALESQLSQIDCLADYQFGMRGERAFCTWTIDYMGRERRMDVLDGGENQDTGVVERMAGPACFHLIPRGWFDQNKASVGRMHLDLILPSVDREARRVSPAVVNRMAGDLEKSLRRATPYNWFGAMLLPALSKASMRSAQGQASVDLARVACALERHRIATGQYPEKLEALAPRFIAKLPHDIISGDPLRYSRTAGDAFLLYSIGWNEKDDGGRIVLNKDERRANWQEGDWVWPMAVK